MFMDVDGQWKISGPQVYLIIIFYILHLLFIVRLDKG